MGFADDILAKLRQRQMEQGQKAADQIREELGRQTAKKQPADGNLGPAQQFNRPDDPAKLQELIDAIERPAAPALAPPPPKPPAPALAPPPPKPPLWRTTPVLAGLGILALAGGVATGLALGGTEPSSGSPAGGGARAPQPSTVTVVSTVTSTVTETVGGTATPTEPVAPVEPPVDPPADAAPEPEAPPHPK